MVFGVTRGVQRNMRHYPRSLTNLPSLMDWTCRTLQAQKSLSGDSSSSSTFTPREDREEAKALARVQRIPKRMMMEHINSRAPSSQGVTKSLGDVMAAPDLLSYVAKEVEQEASVMKQIRKAREERAAAAK